MENKGFERIRKERDNVNYWNGSISELFENGLYDDGRWNKEGKFGKGKKRYWNKVSGKWVGKKIESYKSSKVWFYEFENLDERFIVELFKNEKNEYESFRYIDRVGYFISLVYVIGSYWRNFDDERGGKRGVYLSKSEVIGVLGSKEKYIIDRLIEVGILRKWIVGVNKKDKRKSIVNYWLSEKYIGEIKGKKLIENKSLENFVLKNLEGKDIDWVELEYIKRIELNISANKLEKIINKKYDNKVSEVKRELEWGDEFMSKEDKVKKIEFINGNKEGYIKKINNRYKIFVDIINEVKNGFINKKLFFRDEHGGRYYNVINSLDKEFRKELLLDDEKVVEIDMKSMYVSCLMYMFERINLIRSGLYKKENKKVNKVIKEYLKYYSIKERKNNKIYNGFEWLDNSKEIYSEEVKEFDVENNNWKLDWGDRLELWEWYYKIDKKYYDWGNSVGNNIDELINNIENEEDYLELWNEVSNLWKYSDKWEKYGDGKSVDLIFKYFNIGGKLLSFKRSDNLINDLVNYIDSERSKESYRENNRNNKFFISRDSVFNDGRIIKGSDWRGKNYEEYKKIVGEELKNKFGLELEEKDYKIIFGGDILRLFKNDDDEFEWKKINKDYKIKVGRYLDDKLSKRWKIDEKFRKIYNNNFDELLDKFGVDEYIIVNKEVKVDLSEDSDLYIDEFIEKYKGVVFGGNNKIDFYNYLKVYFSWGYNDGYLIEDGVRVKKGIDNKLKDWGDRKVFNRDFYKMLIMRILFSKSYLVNSIKNFRGDKISESIFGSGYELIWRMKNYDIEKNEYGDFISVNDRIEGYKNISKILSVIEVDVIEYLVNNYFKKLNREYIRIFDGFMVKEKDYWVNRFYLNMILKNDVGYMFDIR